MASTASNATMIGYTGMTDPALVYLSRMILLNTVVASIGFGIQFVFYVAVMRILWNKGLHDVQRVSLMVVTTVLMALGTIYFVTCVVCSENLYIDNPYFPGGFPALMAISSSWTFNVVGLAAYVLESVVADGLLLWRAHTIFKAVGNLYSELFILPAFAVYVMSMVISVYFQLNSAAIGQQLYGSATIQYGTIFFASSFAINVYLTLIITLRIWTYQRRGRTVLGPDFGRTYTTLYSIFVESAALYAVVSIGVFVSFALGNATNQVWIGIGPSVQSIASYLIVYRAAQGRSWDATHGGSRQVSTGLVFTSAGPEWTPGVDASHGSRGSYKIGGSLNSPGTPTRAFSNAAKLSEDEIELGSVPELMMSEDH